MINSSVCLMSGKCNCVWFAQSLALSVKKVNLCVSREKDLFQGV